MIKKFADFLKALRGPVDPDMLVKVRGFIDYKIFDKKGGTLLRTGKGRNHFTTVGLNKVLDVHYRNQTQIASWYMGLIDGSGGVPTLAAGDTMASHAGWTELSSYDEAARPTWTPAAASGGSIVNTSSVDFTASGSITIAGIFLNSVATKDGSTGTLNSTGLFNSNDVLTIAQVCNVTYTFVLTPA